MNGRTRAGNLAFPLVHAPRQGRYLDMARRSPRLLALAGGLLAAALLAAGCSSSYRYVNNAEEKTFFRLPSDVRVFRIKRDTSNRPTPTDLGTTSPWQVVFDASPQPTINHLSDPAPNTIVGQAAVIPVGFDVGEQLSVKQARTELAGGETDPVDAISQGDPNYELVSFASLSEKDGLTGSHIVYNRMVANGVWTTFDQTSLVDIGARKVYFFDVRCEASCFKANRDQISRIVHSWQVRK